VKRVRSFIPWLMLAVGISLTCTVMVLFWTWSYTSVVLGMTRQEGIYPSAEDGMRAVIASAYVRPDDVQIIYAGTNSFDGSNPNVWYVIACVWGGKRADGSPVGTRKHVYDQPGTFFLATKDGWVHVGEGYFPEVLGFWMRVYGLAGPGSARPSHDWGSTPSRGCIF
jgi:hypothetical protein